LYKMARNGYILCCLVFGNMILYLAAETGPQLRTEFGLVKGLYMQSEPNNRKFAAFLGIPFAQPPVESLRFKAPEFPNVFYPPHEPLLATQYKGDCAQLELGSSEIKGSEDCLYLNVFTPDIELDGSADLPVMVWIHGGGFLIGSSDPSFYGPERFLNEDVVLVTFNYRLGALGFLTNGLEENPANIGILDQIKALQWVKHNIKFFGGDRDRITVFGQSSGADSVLALMSSPRATDLFQQGIAMSGAYASSNIFLHKCKPIPHYASILAVEVGCGSSPLSSPATLQCLREKPVEDILRQAQTFVRYNFLNNPFKPTPDPDAEHPVLPDALDEVWKKAARGNNQFDRPLMIGGNKDDGIISYLDFLKDSTLFGVLNREFYREGPVLLLSADPEVSEKDESESATAKTLSTIYLQASNFTEEKRTEIINMLTDIHFLANIDKTVRELQMISSAPIYYYNYQYQGSFSLPMAFGHMEQIGVSSTDELFLMFRHEEVSRSWLGDLALQTEDDIRMSRKMLELWTEFAATGNPTKDGSWSPVGEKLEYAVIDQNELRMEYPKEFAERMTKVQGLLQTIYKHRNLNMKEHPILAQMEKQKKELIQKELEEEEALRKQSQTENEKPAAEEITKPVEDLSVPKKLLTEEALQKTKSTDESEPALKITLDSGIEMEVADGDLLGAMQLLADMENEASEKVRRIKEQMRKDEEQEIAEQVYQDNIKQMRDEL